ncbi:MAG: DUF4861 family protein [Bacteroidales bacterium]
MNRLLILFASLLFLSSCQNFINLKVSVFNPLDFERINETVEIEWAAIERVLPNIHPDELCVLDDQGTSLITQLLYKGEKEPQSLIFQVRVPANGKTLYSISKRKKANTKYSQNSSTRFFKKTKEGFLWGNNNIVYRTYAMGTLKSNNSIDNFCLSDSCDIVDNSFQCILASSSLAPYIDNNLILNSGFAISKLLDSGAIRISFELTYPPIDIEGELAVEKRRISLDANECFNSITEMFVGAKTMPVAADIELNYKGGKSKNSHIPILNISKGYIVHTQNVDIMQEGATIHSAIVMPTINRMQEAKIQEDRVLAIANYNMDEPITYYSGAVWGSDSIALSMEQWENYVARTVARLNFPLQVRLR